MSRILIIGAGGVGNVVTKKCALRSDVFTDIWLASRTQSKCDAIAAEVRERFGADVTTAAVDADNVTELAALIERCRPELVINVALPYQDLTIMDACLACGVDCIHSAMDEPEDTAHFEYSWQWAYQERFKERVMGGSWAAVF